MTYFTLKLIKISTQRIRLVIFCIFQQMSINEKKFKLKDKNHQCASQSLKTFQLPYPVCDGQPQAYLVLRNR